MNKCNKLTPVLFITPYVSLLELDIGWCAYKDVEP